MSSDTSESAPGGPGGSGSDVRPADPRGGQHARGSKSGSFFRELPFLGVLLKKEQDVETVATARKSGTFQN